MPNVIIYARKFKSNKALWHYVVPNNTYYYVALQLLLPSSAPLPRHCVNWFLFHLYPNNNCTATLTTLRAIVVPSVTSYGEFNYFIVFRRKFCVSRNLRSEYEDCVVGGGVCVVTSRIRAKNRISSQFNMHQQHITKATPSICTNWNYMCGIRLWWRFLATFIQSKFNVFHATNEQKKLWIA